MRLCAAAARSERRPPFSSVCVAARSEARRDATSRAHSWRCKVMLVRARARVGPSRVAGVDEAGRGPLAGPVVAAAVILHPRRRIDGLADSKVLTAEERER